MPIRLYTPFKTPDTASLTYNGVHYRCTVWKDRGRRTIEAMVTIEQAAGQEVVFHRETLWTTTATESDLYWAPESPKVIAVGSDFVCHWIDAVFENTDVGYGPSLHKSTLSIDTFDTVPEWAYQSFIAIGDNLLHDIQPLTGSDTDYVVTYSTTLDLIRVVRQDGLTWSDVVWSVAHSSVGHSDRVLACYGHLADADVMIGFQAAAAPAGFTTVRFDAATGLGALASLSFTTLGASNFSQVGFARFQASDVVLVVEAMNTASGAEAADVPNLAMVRVSSTTSAPISTEHSAYHLRMLSRPWCYAGAREDALEPNAYVLAAYSQVANETDNAQRNAYVLNLAALHWDDAGVVDHTIRPRICGNLNQGTLDCRTSGWTPSGGTSEINANGRRFNHVSSASLPPPYGPFRATRTIAAMGFPLLLTQSSPAAGGGRSRLSPVSGTILNVVAHPEEPWVVRRDPQEPVAAAPSTNSLVSYPWTVGAASEAGGALFIAGGSPAVFDGFQLVENGYAWAPEIISSTETGLETTIDAGDYLYVATYEWRDAQGQLHRSAPSSVYEAPTHVDGVVTLVVSTMTISQRDNRYWYPQASPIEVVLYRANANGDGIFRRLYARFPASNFNVEDAPVNDPATWFIEVDDLVSEANIAFQALLPYQLNGGGGWVPLPPYCPPAFSCHAKWQNRVWASSSEDPRLIWYSQELLPEPGGVYTLPPEWNASLTFRIDEVGLVTALHPMDNQLVVFTDRAIYSITGFASDSTGQNSQLQLAPITLGTGCIEPRSVVYTPIGLFFQGFKGLYLLGRTGQLEYLNYGASVEDTVSRGGNIRAATLMEDRHEVRFVTNSAVTGGPMLIIYDYQHDLWSTADLPLGDQPGGSQWLSSTAGGAQWRGVESESLHITLEQGAVLVERASDDATPYTDEDRNSEDPVLLDVETERIQLDGIAGFQRVKNIVIVLDKPNASPVNVQLWYDVDGNVNELTEIVTFSTPASPVLRIKPRVQKCTSLRLRIYEVAASAPSTESIQITGCHLNVAVKRNIRKV